VSLKHRSDTQSLKSKKEKMRAVIQRVSKAEVRVAERIVGSIERGLLVLVGVQVEDTQRDVDYLASKTAGLRIFEDEQGLMNLGIQQVAGDILAVSQFTLLGDVRRGKRPSFTEAARPEIGKELYEAYCQALRRLDLRVEQGVFQADMQVSSINEGPVTILLDSRKTF
jgi:D-tyrosyl-tRNA(Tyr) deacylase